MTIETTIGHRTPKSIRRGCAALLSAGAVLTVAHAGSRIGHETPLLRVPRLSGPPTLDGRVADGEWDPAATVSSLRHFRTGSPSAHHTGVRVAITNEALYVAFECLEAEAGRLVRGRLAHDSPTLFARDHVEVFLMPDALARPFYHFSVDVFGNRHDECGSDASWNGNWEAVTGAQDGGWTVEMCIPKATVGMDKPRLVLGNFCRTRRIKPGETSAWSPTFGPFHNPARFGRIVFGPPAPARLLPLSMSHSAVGRNLLEATVEDAPSGAKVKAYALRGDRVRSLGARSVPDCTLEVTAEEDGEVDVVVTVEKDGTVLDFRHAFGVALSGVKPKPIRRVLGPKAAPSMRWMDADRLRGISYAVYSGATMPEDGLEKGDPLLGPATLHLRGQSHFRFRPERNEPLRFDLAAEAGECVFTQAIYAVFDPDGKQIAEGLVDAGQRREVTVATQTEGTHVLLINSGPAMWNPFTLTVHNRYWVLDARGKSRYMGTPVAYHSLRDCKLAGCNLALMAAWNWGIPFGTEQGLAQWRARLEGLCAAAQKAGIRIIPYLGWGCSRHDCDSVSHYTRALTRLSVRGPQPCPASREYWEGSFLRRALVVAELSKTYPCVTGVGLDPESYYFNSWYRKNLETEAEQSRIWGVVMPMGGSREKCICDECMAGLVQTRGIADPHLPPDGNVRFDWIAKQGIIEELCATQQARLEKTLVGVRQRLQAVNPDFGFAVMHLSTGDDWFRRGMARGFGTERVPVLDFDEGTYTSGYRDKAVTTKLERYRGWQAHVIHGGTLWMLKHPPANQHFLAAQLFNFALYGHSYWVWPGSMSLWRSADRVQGYYSLSGYAEDYWAAIALANREIDRRLAAPASYRSVLERIEPRAKIPTQPDKQNDWALKPCYPVHVYGGTRLSFCVPPGAGKVRIVWGYREALGEQTLVAGLAEETREATADIRAEERNILELTAPPEGAMGWLELRRRQPSVCVGIKIEGASPFFGGAEGMSLR